MDKNTPWIKPVGKKSLSKTVMDSIRDGILSGDLLPGQFLPSETELAEKFGVGKSSIREAVKMLEAMGYIEICKGNGSRVRTSIDPAIINPLVFQLILTNNKSRDQLFEFRISIEAMASCLAIDKADENDIKAIEENIKRTREHLEDGIDTIDDDLQFHSLMYKATHNDYIELIGETVMGLFHPSLKVSNSDYPEIVVGDHEGICAALKNKDKAMMERAVRNSLSHWYIHSLKDNGEER